MTEMKQKEILQGESFRFEIYKGKIAQDGSFVQTRTAGHAYLRTGKHAYKVKLFTLPHDRFIIVPGNESSDHYKILTKEEVTTKDKGKKTYWNVVGEAQVMAQLNVLKLKFDLFGEPLYMSLYPSNAGNVLPFQVSPDWNAA
jgi:hypothetical protein